MHLEKKGETMQKTGKRLGKNGAAMERHEEMKETARGKKISAITVRFTG